MKPAPVRRAPGKAAGLAGGKQVAAPDTSAAGVKAAIRRLDCPHRGAGVRLVFATCRPGARRSFRFRRRRTRSGRYPASGGGSPER